MAKVTPTADSEMLPETVIARETLMLFEAEFTVATFPNSKLPASTWNCRSESALNATETGAISTAPEVEILERVFAVSSKNALERMVMSAEELVTSPDVDAPSDLAFAVLQLI